MKTTQSGEAKVPIATLDRLVVYYLRTQDPFTPRPSAQSVFMRSVAAITRPIRPTALVIKVRLLCVTLAYIDLLACIFGPQPMNADVSEPQAHPRGTAEYLRTKWSTP